MVWKVENPQGNESAKIKWEIVPYTRGKVLELGSGPWRTFSHFVTFDNLSEWQGNWKPDIIGGAEDLSCFASNFFDAVFSSHLLEHIEDTRKTLREWWRVIQPGGHLILYLPHKDFYPNIGDPLANQDHIHDFLPKDIIEHMKVIGGFDLVVSEARNQDDEYSFLQIYKKLKNKNVRFSYSNPKPEKTCAIIRYGGFGDMIQLSPIAASLKDQYYHVTLYTTPSAYQAIKHDPNIDQVILQDKDQVPNGELHMFWESISKKYDKFINLSESVEGSFLALYGRAPYYWTKEARHKYMNYNYDEFAHLIAGVSKRHNAKFYPTSKEIQWAEKFRKKINSKLIMMVLSGSSVHKVYPWIDQIVAHYMLKSDYEIVFVGGDMEKYLEAPWRDEKRIHRLSGKVNVRQTMTLAAMCNMVFGPETGVLNAVSYEEVPKVILLSHSSVENLTQGWINCTSLYAEKCPCYPCHRMIYGFRDCVRDSHTGVSLCASMITPDIVIGAMDKWLRPARIY